MIVKKGFISFSNFFIFRIHYHSNVSGQLYRLRFFHPFSWETIPYINSAQGHVSIWHEFPQLSVKLQQPPAADPLSPPLNFS